MITDRTCLMTLKRYQTIFCASLMLPAMVAPSSASAGELRHDARSSETLLTDCIQRAARGKPWLEKTLWGLRDQEGGWPGAEIKNSNGSHDLGPLQVNSWWVGRFAQLTGRPAVLVRYWLVNDVCFNVDAARWIFLTNLAATRSYWEAIGLYHSPTGWRQRRYVRSVALHLKRRFGERVFLRQSR